MEKNQLIEQRNKYEKVYQLLDMLENLFGIADNNMDLDTMNHWLSNIIKFYKTKGVELSESDFVVHDDAVANSIVKKYMNVYFLNFNKLNDGINSEYNNVFNDLILRMPELEFSDNYINPILSYIYIAVRNIHAKNIRIITDLLSNVNAWLNKFGIDNISLDNLSATKVKVGKKINNIKSKIKQFEVLEKENKLKETSQINLCMMITGNNYINMNDEQKEYVISNLDRICLSIIKLRIFNNVSEEYYRYSMEADYQHLLDTVKGKKIMIDIIRDKIIGLSKIPFKRLRNKMILKLNKQLLLISNEIQELISSYLNGFYGCCDMHDLVDKYNVSGMYDTSKLFGEFDFESLPINSNKVNLRVEYFNHGIIIPDVDSPEFSKLSIFALRYLNRDNTLFNYGKSFSRKRV